MEFICNLSQRLRRANKKIEPRRSHSNWAVAAVTEGSELGARFDVRFVLGGVLLFLTTFFDTLNAFGF